MAEILGMPRRVRKVYLGAIQNCLGLLGFAPCQLHPKAWSSSII